ncbi:MAG TPA: YncE family protein [Verrucomicrobiae bacterium]|nr:YncE family protein [Verrucomicrobiae bacterium]
MKSAGWETRWGDFFRIAADACTIMAKFAPRKLLAIAALIVFGLGAAFPPPLAAKALKKIATIELPGPSGKAFGSLAIDSENHLLFCAHAGADSLYVVDLAGEKLLHTISGLPGVRGVAYAADSKKIYASLSGMDSIGVISGTNFEVLKKIPTEASPGPMAYAAGFGKIFVSDELARAVAVIDVASDTVVNMVRFESRTAGIEYDPAAKRIYVNLPDASQLAAIDPATETVAARYALGRCSGNEGMALDAVHRLAFLSCEEANLLAVFDLRTNQAAAYLPMAAGGAGVALDAKLDRIYVACASGTISVYEEKGSRCRRMGDVSAAHSVHSLAIDPLTGRIYVPEQEEDGVPVAQLAVYEERP